MKVIDIINKSRKPFPSLEIVPPQNGIVKEELWNTIEQFMPFHPKYINITCHRDIFEYTEEKDGSYTRHLVRNRINPVTVCAAIMQKFNVTLVPHIICGGFTEEENISQLYNLRFLGIENVMALRGDSILGEKRFVPEKGGFCHTNELVSAIRRFNEEQEADFCVGVGAYPEKHFEAANMETDIAMLKQKVDAGADYIITQLFYDNEKFYAFERQCRRAGISVPIIPGLKPISTLRQIALLPQSFYIDIPVELTKSIEDAARGQMLANGKLTQQARSTIYNIGTQWCIAQCKDLLKHGVPAIHFYTMGKPKNIVEILKECF